MNNDKAIALLRRMQEPEAYEPKITAEAFEALDMAIKALERASFPQAHENDHIAEVSKMDCISRQAAIDAVGYYSLHSGDKLLFADKPLKELPSAQSEQRWIPWGSGKFPEESGTYTVTAYDGATKRVTYAKYQKRLKRWELTGARAYWRVLAWMPLPEPWKGEQPC